MGNNTSMPRLAVRVNANQTMPLYQFISNVQEGKIPIYSGQDLIGWASKNEPIHRAVSRIDPSRCSAGQMTVYVIDDGDRFRAEYTAYVLR